MLLNNSRWYNFPFVSKSMETFLCSHQLPRKPHNLSYSKTSLSESCTLSWTGCTPLSSGLVSPSTIMAFAVGLFARSAPGCLLALGPLLLGQTVYGKAMVTERASYCLAVNAGALKHRNVITYCKNFKRSTGRHHV